MQIMVAVPCVIEIVDQYLFKKKLKLNQERLAASVQSFTTRYYELSFPTAGLPWRAGKRRIDDAAVCLAIFASELSGESWFDCKEFYETAVPRWLKVMLRRSGRELPFLDGNIHQLSNHACLL